MLAYGKGYVALQGQTLRVIPHVQNLETCARHCDMDSQCTHWRRCAGVLLYSSCPLDRAFGCVSARGSACLCAHF